MQERSRMAFSQAVEKAGLSLAGIALLCDVSERTTRNWADGTSPVPRWAIDAVQRAGASAAEVAVRLRLELAMAESALWRIEAAAQSQHSAVHELREAVAAGLNPGSTGPAAPGSDAPAG